MTTNPRLSSIVVFVTDLDRSVDFYQDLLGGEVVVRETEGLLLEVPGDNHLWLRALNRPPHFSGNIGVQYAVWSLGSKEQLDRAEKRLVARQAFVSRSHYDSGEVVEGTDPDRIPVLMYFPTLGKHHLAEVFSRIYSY